MAALFIILPAIGFYAGIRYQQKLIRINQIPVSSSQTQSNLSPNMLIIIRPEDKQDDLPMMTKTITDTNTVMKLYHQIEVLPDMPKGKLNCPLSFFVTYTLDFFQNDTQVISARFNPTGCRTIEIFQGKAKWVLGPKGTTFITTLQQTLELTDAEFYGHQNHKITK